MSKSKRIAKNTLMLYVRMLFAMFVGLYTSRIVLNALGVSDFGIYKVVGGIVTMFTIVSGSLSAASSRFLTFQLGKGDTKELKKVFFTAVSIHILLAILVLLFAELIGVWFLNSKMNIPSDRLLAANWVFQLSIFTFIVNLISIPYNASIISHEHMKAFAFIGIIEIVLKLLVVFLVLFIHYDKLILYSFLLLLVSIIIRFIYGIYCNKHFEECKYKFAFNKKLFIEMSSFAGWNFVGVSSTILRQQGVDIVLNIFHGTVVNAARGIASQVNHHIGGFARNFMKAIDPQITKSFASGDLKYMKTLIQQGARLSFYILFLLAFPIIIETEYVLKIWLINVPQHSVLFVRLVLALTLTESLSYPLITAVLATGKIKKYQVIVGGVQMLNLPFSYVFLKLGYFPEITVVIAISLSLACLMIRLFILKDLIGLPVKFYINNVFLNILVVTTISLVIPIFISKSLEQGPLRLIIVTCISLINSLLVMYFIGSKKSEQKFVREKVHSYLKKIIKK